MVGRSNSRKMDKMEAVADGVLGKAERSEQDEEFNRRWASIMAGMTPEQREVVEKEVAAIAAGDAGWGALTSEVVMLALDQRPPVMHPDLAQAIIDGTRLCSRRGASRRTCRS